MKAIDAYQKLRAMKVPAISTADAGACLQISAASASKLLSRLASHNLIIKLTRGLWLIDDTVDPMALHEYLTAPWPSYISLQSALFYHGMIEQIPQCIYLISLGRTQIISTPLAKFSIHQINVNMFFGFESVSPTLKLASAEKAICDLLYLSPARSKLFTNLPEITFPDIFNKTLVLEFIGKIQSPSRRKLALTRLNRLLTLGN